MEGARKHARDFGKSDSREHGLCTSHKSQLTSHSFLSSDATDPLAVHSLIQQT